MELIHIANATFSSSRIKSNQLISLENLASKTKTYQIVKEQHDALSRTARSREPSTARGRERLASSRVVAQAKRTMRKAGGQRERWWSQPGSNRRPSGCKPDALPAELWPLPDPPTTHPLEGCGAQ